MSIANWKLTVSCTRIVPMHTFSDGTVMDSYEATDKIEFEFVTLGECMIALEKLSYCQNFHEIDATVTKIVKKSQEVGDD